MVRVLTKQKEITKNDNWQIIFFWKATFSGAWHLQSCFTSKPNGKLGLSVQSGLGTKVLALTMEANRRGSCLHETKNISLVAGTPTEQIANLIMSSITTN
ncbi:hypothetical protein DHW03_09025 [Pedobacter yonginense]|uniref:Uncharacterized protein n=1 Tax=Pedobacter yonginense TaxID=651869 RepID=A0A317EMC6_9SPHI|nr:hypothetical protein [Pedobacter yonginense]PWS27712.1 hypothetical protein DHW03_09025 [Pedobacter yonginense]